MKTPKRKGVTKGQMLEAIKDIGNRQDKIVEWIQAINQKLNLVDSVLGNYVEFKEDTNGFQEYIKEQDEKRKKEAEDSAKLSDEEE